MWDMGIENAANLYGVGKCGQYGKNTHEKPWFGDVAGVVMWDYWTKYNDTP